jgi:hypothetical protein
VDESVDHGDDDVAEDFAPAVERLVGGDDQAGTLKPPWSNPSVTAYPGFEPNFSLLGTVKSHSLASTADRSLTSSTLDP